MNPTLRSLLQAAMLTLPMTLAAFVAGRWSVRTAENLPQNDRAVPAAPLVVASSSARPAAPPGTNHDSDCESVKNELELARAAVSELERELYGIPKAWTPDVPPDYQPDAVMDRVRQVFSDCDVPGDLVGFDCDEQPCFALMDATESATAVSDAVVGCPTWKDAWGTGVGSANRPVHCPDGSARTLLMLSPGSKPVSDEERAELLAHGLTEAQMRELENSEKRLNARLSAAEERICAGD